MDTLPFSSWSDFYVIVGSSAAALTGLQFVVIVLAAEAGLGAPTTTTAFATPTIVHFCAVVLIAAIMTAPWPSPIGAAAVLGVLGMTGVGYAIFIIRKATRQTDYVPVFEDWLTHFALPLFSYAVLIAASLLLGRNALVPLFMVAGAAVSLLFVGIHNAWDSATFIAHESRKRRREDRNGL